MKKILLIPCLAAIIFSCNSKSTNDKAAVMEAAKQITIDSMQAVIIKNKIVDSMKRVEVKEQAKHTPLQENNVSTGSPTTETKKKKKWSGTAKGAVIGAGTGAIAGAIIDKKSGRGAIIGGVVGAGAGAATGAIIDKNKKKKKSTNQ